MATVSIWSKIEIQHGDITKLAVDAIVNAANSRLAGGGGVDGAIHHAAGAVQLHAACHKLAGCETGDAKITPGFDLPAKHIIHTVGPVYRDGRHGEAELLASCYRRSIEIARENGLQTIALPAISTGIYGYPFEAATEIAFRTAAEVLAESPGVQRVIFVFFGASDHAAACAILERLTHGTT